MKVWVNRHSVVEAVWQIAALLLIASGVGFALNAIRSDGIPVTGVRPPEARQADPSGQPVVSPGEAERLWRSGKAVILDARSGNAYTQGHVRGALSLPWPEAEAKFPEVAEQIPVDRVIITYCDGEGCELSLHLAEFLRDLGFPDVRIMENGWTRWQKAGLPIEGSG